MDLAPYSPPAILIHIEHTLERKKRLATMKVTRGKVTRIFDFFNDSLPFLANSYLYCNNISHIALEDLKLIIDKKKLRQRNEMIVQKLSLFHVSFVLITRITQS